MGFDSQAAPYPAPPSLDGTAAAAIDGDYGTQWASAFASGTNAMPHWLTIDVGGTYSLTGLQYSVKNQSNGPVSRYAVYVTNDATVAKDPALAGWGSTVATGTLTQPSRSAQRQTISFDNAVTGRYVRFVALSSINGSNNASISELHVLAAGSSSRALYQATTEGTGRWGHPDDTPASLFINRDGTFYAQQAHALYGASEGRAWSFFSGENLDDAKPAPALNQAAAPGNPADRNNETTIRCNNSPTGAEATKAPAGSNYSQRNYCDLTQIWVDPDTGHWYGLVHNEFTPQPFSDGLHYDGIDYAVSTDQGKTWTIKDHVITSPFSTRRGDTAAFPQQTYYYGDGDPRLYVDTASGYFYMYYGSRVVDKGGTWKAFHQHVARSPISAKMAPGSWQKWYDGKWSQPGLGGMESNMVPVSSASSTGYTDPAKEYSPNTPGTTTQQVAAGTTPRTSPLFVMDITYDAHLGLYIGQPENPDHSGQEPQQYYATRDLATQKWFLLDDTGDKYTTSSWYRWFVDPANRTSSAIVGKTFRSYCSFECDAGASGDYATVTIDTNRPAAPVQDGGVYTVTTAGKGSLSQKPGSRVPGGAGRGSSFQTQWRFTSTDDGAYTITNARSGDALGVDSTSTTGRAWGAAAQLGAPGARPTVGQQWFLVPGTSPVTGEPNGTFRVVNRYSGLVLDLGGGKVTTQPGRTWDRGTDRAADQTISLGRVTR